MPYQASDTVKNLFVLLNNAKELSIDHNNRNLATDTINSCFTLCKSRNFGIKKNILDALNSLIYAIKNYPSEALMEKFSDVEEFIVSLDIEKDVEKPQTPQPKIPTIPYSNMSNMSLPPN